jgi:hypothetical protein
MPRGKFGSREELVRWILDRAWSIVLSLRPRTTRAERVLLGFDSYHNDEFCELCQLSQLEAWREM